MTSSRRHLGLAALLALVAAFAVPASAGAQTGGAEAQTSALEVRPAALFQRTLRIAGEVDAAEAGRGVRIEVLDPVAGWREAARTLVEADGAFVARWVTDVLGRVELRAIVEREGEASAASAPQAAQVTIFRGAVASWYGPGFWGKKTACGVKLTKRTLGVAHKSLPCGTPVDLYYKGRTITVPVIYRGPFHRGREWDLTKATARALGVLGTGRIGVLTPPLPAAA
jgi:rare lipoprotein A